jgi:hypothetical protein
MTTPIWRRLPPPMAAWDKRLCGCWRPCQLPRHCRPVPVCRRPFGLRVCDRGRDRDLVRDHGRDRLCAHAWVPVSMALCELTTSVMQLQCHAHDCPSQCSLHPGSPLASPPVQCSISRNQTRAEETLRAVRGVSCMLGSTAKQGRGELRSFTVPSCGWWSGLVWGRVNPSRRLSLSHTRAFPLFNDASRCTTSRDRGCRHPIVDYHRWWHPLQ